MRDKPEQIPTSHVQTEHIRPCFRQKLLHPSLNSSCFPCFKCDLQQLLSQGCTLVELVVGFGDQSTAKSQSIDSEFDEFSGVFQINTARRHKRNLREGTAELA